MYVFYGTVVFVLSLLKPCNIAMGHYGSSRHNKCALLIILTFDAFAIFVQLIVAGFFLADGVYEVYGEGTITGRRMDGCKAATCTADESAQLRKACNRSRLPEGSVFTDADCRAYFGSDRTAGFRLAWMAEYAEAIRMQNQGKKMSLDELQGKGMCCGFAPPDACDRVVDDNDFPCSGGLELEGRALSCDGVHKDMLKQRWKCSSKNPGWYPIDKFFKKKDPPCLDYADGENVLSKENSLGCRTDWATGLCIFWEVDPESTGCAVYYEGIMNAKLYPSGLMLLFTVFVETATIVIACFYCWKRKDHDVLSTAYIYDEPWDPVKEGKLHVGLQEAEAMGGDGDDD